jgi:hypothetical protein
MHSEDLGYPEGGKEGRLFSGGRQARGAACTELSEQVPGMQLPRYCPLMTRTFCLQLSPCCKTVVGAALTATNVDCQVGHSRLDPGTVRAGRRPLAEKVTWRLDG